MDRRGFVRALEKCTATWIAGALALVASSAQAPAVYRVYVASEAADRITLLRFDGSGGRIEREIDTGVMPTDIDGPHGLAVSPDKRFFYVSLAHGQPFGSVLKYRRQLMRWSAA